MANDHLPGKTCRKCGYARTGTEAAPTTECPGCGAIYAKVEARLDAGASIVLREAPRPAATPQAATNLTQCQDCGGSVSVRATACPHCGAPLDGAQPAGAAPTTESPASVPQKKGTSPVTILLASIFAIWLFSVIADGGSGASGSAKAERGFRDVDALTLCQMTLKQFARDPGKAEIPYVQNFGSGSEFQFAWGASTKHLRLRNGLGLDVAATASCTVDRNTRRITTLTLNGQTLI